MTARTDALAARGATTEGEPMTGDDTQRGGEGLRVTRDDLERLRQRAIHRVEKARIQREVGDRIGSVESLWMQRYEQDMRLFLAWIDAAIARAEKAERMVQFASRVAMVSVVSDGDDWACPWCGRTQPMVEVPFSHAPDCDWLMLRDELTTYFAQTGVTDWANDPWESSGNNTVDVLRKEQT